MKYVIQTILLLFTLGSYSQNKPKSDPVKRILNSSFVVFTADNSGCFGGEIITYKFVKQKNGDRKVSYQKNGKAESKKVTSKDYSAFSKNYTLSYNKFKDPDAVKQTCTSVSVLSINAGKDSIGFKNVTCQAELNPEMFLQSVLK